MSLRLKLLSTAAIAAVMTGFAVNGARAADVVAEPAAHDWSGLYFGAHVGWGDGNFEGCLDCSDGEDDSSAMVADELSIGDVVGGVHAGYNAQFDNLVLGIEADFTWAGLEDEQDEEGDGDSDHLVGRVDYLATVRARAGVAMDNLLIYATGGLAFMDGKIDSHQHGNNETADFNDLGGVVGGGLEWAVSPSVSFRAEGLYYFFGDKQDVSDFHSADEGEELEFDDAFVARVGASIHPGGLGMGDVQAAGVVGEPGAFSWTGFYIGAHVGYGDGNFGGCLDCGDGDDDSSALNGDDLSVADVIGGVHAGYNVQFDALVLGIEADYTWVGLEDEQDEDGGSDHIVGEIDYLATVRARAGFAMDNLLIYATGGLAFTDARINAHQHGNHDQAEFDDMGGVVGGGFEWAASERVSFRAEGLYYFFGEDEDVSDFHSAEDGEELEFDDAFAVRVGTSIHFNGI